MAVETGSEIQVVVGAETSEFEAGFKRASGIVDQFGRSFGAGLAPLTPATEKGNAGLKGLLATLMEWRKEQVMQGRQARFFANELTSFVPASAEAKAGVQGLLGVFLEGAAGGLSFGLGLEVVKFGVETVTSALEEHKRVTEEVGQVQSQATTIIYGYIQAWRELNNQIGVGEKGRERARQQGQQAIDLIDEEIKKLREAGATKMEAVRNALDFGVRATTENDKRIAELEEQRRKATNRMKFEMTRTGLVEEKRLRERNEEDTAEVHARGLSRRVQMEVAYQRQRKQLLRETAGPDQETPAFQAKLAEMDKQHAREVAEYDRGLARQLADAKTQLAMVGLGKRTAIERAGAASEMALSREIADAKAKDDKQLVAVLQARMALTRAQTAERLKLYDAERAKVQEHLAQVEEERRQAEALEEIKTRAAARDLAAAEWDSQLAARRTQIAVKENEEYAAAAALRESGDIASEEEYQAVKTEIARRGVEARRQAEQESWSQQHQYAAGMIESMTSNWEQGFQQMMQGSYRWQDFSKNLWKSMAGSFTQMAAKMAADWLKTQMLNVAAGRWAQVQQVAIETWGAAKRLAIAAWEGVKKIAMYAWEGAAATYKAIASIPYVGPFLAPALAGAALGAILAFGTKLASAEGGYDIPRGVNPLVQTHAEEMILPAKYANLIRGMAENGAPGGAGGSAPISVSLNVQALDGQDVTRVLMKNQGAVLKVLGEAVRNGRRS